jgi:hypothetical protein
MRIDRILPLLAAALLGTAACSGADDLLVPDTWVASVSVVGQWVSSMPANDGAHTEERMTFGDDGSFSSEILWIGFHGRPAAEVTGYYRTRGSYALDGDRLMVRTTRAEQWQKYAVGENPSVVTTSNPIWTERGTLAVAGDRLLHTYVSAPADAPETFTQVYQRER